MKTKLESPFSIHDIVKYKFETKEQEKQQHLIQTFFEVIEINIQQCYSAVQVFLILRPIQYDIIYKLKHDLNKNETEEWVKSGKLPIKHSAMNPHDKYIKLRADEVIDANSEFKKLIK